MAVNLITIRFFAAAKAATNVSQFEVDARSLGEALELATNEFPNLRNALPRCSYLVNGQATKENSAPLNEDDVVDVLPPFAGG